MKYNSPEDYLTIDRKRPLLDWHDVPLIEKAVGTTTQLPGVTQ